MTLFSKTMLCCSPLMLALGFSGPVTNAALQAQEPAPVAHFIANLAEAPEKARFAAGGVIWSCDDTRCTAPQATSRPLRICRELQREAGPVAKFIVKGEEMAEDKMARCNR